MLRALREAKGLTLEDLAKKAKTTKEYISMLETGARKNPSLAVRKQLAKALGVSVIAFMQPSRIARAMRLKFDACKLLPLNDPISVPFLRLMIAADDARHLHKLILRAPVDVNEENETERVILEGELGHLNRLLCGHLYEAGCAFRDLDRLCPGRLDAAFADNKEAKAALAYVRQLCPPGKGKGLWYSFLNPIRHAIGFHYKPEQVRASLAKHQDSAVFQGSLALVEYSGLSRSTITDVLVKLVTADALGKNLGKDIDTFVHDYYPGQMKETIKFAGALIEVVDHFLTSLFDKHPTAILEQDNDVITIPTWLWKELRKRKSDRPQEGGDGRKR